MAQLLRQSTSQAANELVIDVTESSLEWMVDGTTDSNESIN